MPPPRGIPGGRLLLGLHLDLVARHDGAGDPLVARGRLPGGAGPAGGGLARPSGFRGAKTADKAL
eukprot:5995170-Alexandrium_andersonii.AAC.1